MRAALRLLFIAALAAAAVVSADDGAVEGSAKAEENSRAEEAKQLLANAKLPEWMNTEGQQKSLCCSLATPGYEKALLNCVRRNGPMPVGVTAEEESDGYTQEEGKKARQKKSLDGSGRILVLMEYPEDQDVEVVAHTAAVNSAYAAAHGYSFLLDKPEPKPGKPRTKPWNKVSLLMKHVDSGLWDWVLWLDWDVMVADQTAMMRTIFENVLPSHALIASGPPKEKPWGVQVFSSGVMLVKGDENGMELLEQWWYSWTEEAFDPSMAYVMLWHKDPSAQNRTGLIKQTIFTTHGRTSLAFPDTPQNTTFFVAHMWDQPREVLRRLTRAGHAETCRSAEAGGLPFAFHRGWMVPEVIKGVNELLAEQEKLPKWGMPERVPRADEDEDEADGDDDEEDPTDPSLVGLPEHLWEDDIPTTVLEGHPVRVLVGNLFFAAAEAEEMGHLNDAYSLAHKATRIATATNCPGCDWYAREALYILGRMEAKAVDGTEKTAGFVEQSRQRCRDASLLFPASPRGKQCLKEVNEYLDKLFAFLEEQARKKREGGGEEGAGAAGGEEEHAKWAAGGEGAAAGGAKGEGGAGKEEL